MDAELVALRRALSADPADGLARARYAAVLLRIHAEEHLPLLADVAAWDAADPDAQDAAVSAAAARLGPRFRWEGAEVHAAWLATCPGCEGTGQTTERETIEGRARTWLEPCPECGATGSQPPGAGRELRHRVALFRHLPTGLELCLLPGRPRPFLSGVGPFLLARTAVPRGAFGGDVAPSEAGLPKLVGRPHQDQFALVAVEAWCRERGLRLPTQNEWEHGCFNGEEEPLHWPIPDPAEAVTCGCDHPHAAARYAAHPNALGLVEMLGNCWEVTAEGALMGGACIDPSLPLPDPRNDLGRWVPGHLIGFRPAASIPGFEPRSTRRRI